MRTTILLTIEHTKPLPDITDVICQRVWPYGGGCITDMTAAIQEPETLHFSDEEHIDRMSNAIAGMLEGQKKPGFWRWMWREQS